MATPYRVADDDVMAPVRDAVDDDRRDAGGGGVHPRAIADYSKLAAETLTDRCRKLEQDGRLVEMHGWGPELKARKSYLPADHEDAPSEEDSRVWPNP